MVDYMSSFLKYVQYVKGTRKPLVLSSQSMTYPESKQTVTLIPPVYYKMKASELRTPTELYALREEVLWKPSAPTNTVIDSYNKELTSLQTKLKQDREQDDKTYKAVISKEQDIYDEKMAYTIYMDSQNTAHEIPTLEKSKRNQEIVKVFKNFSHKDHSRRLKIRQKIESMPSFSITTPGEVRISNKQNVGKKVDKKKEPETPPETEINKTLYVEEVPRASEEIKPITNKDRAKKQWVRDMLSNTGFSFKTADECAMKRHLTSHYLSKNDIIRVLDANPDYAEALPPSYKTATKEQLCGMLFHDA